jgi:sarcosine oxidase
MVSASDATSAHQRLALDCGATLRDHTTVVSLRDVDGEIEVGLDGGEVLGCETVIVCADAWTNAVLAGLEVQLPLTVTQEQVTYFAAADPDSFAPGRFPVWIWMADPSFYGFPIDGGRGVKAAEDCGGLEVTGDTRTFEPDRANLGRLSAFVADHLPISDARPRRRPVSTR